MGKSFSIFGETVVANMLISGSFGLVSGLVETCALIKKLTNHGPSIFITSSEFFPGFFAKFCT